MKTACIFKLKLHSCYHNFSWPYVYIKFSTEINGQSCNVFKPCLCPKRQIFSKGIFVFVDKQTELNN